MNLDILTAKIEPIIDKPAPREAYKAACNRYEVVTTNGADQTCRYPRSDYQSAIEQALEETHCWPNHDVLVYGMGALICVYRNGVKTER